MGTQASTPERPLNAGTEKIEFGYNGKKFNAVCVTNKNGLRYYTIETLAKLPTFSHASVSPNRTVKVSGCIGFKLGTMELGSSVADETKKALTHIDCILTCIGADLESITKINVFLKDGTKERTMEYNKAYAEFFEEKGLTALPPRITVGCGELALGANMEIEADAYLP